MDVIFCMLIMKVFIIGIQLNNKKTIRVTFEIFWIIVFLLRIITRDVSIEIPQFIYVNF